MGRSEERFGWERDGKGLRGRTVLLLPPLLRWAFWGSCEMGAICREVFGEGVYCGV